MKFFRSALLALAALIAVPALALEPLDLMGARVVSTASTNATNVKPSIARIYHVTLSNTAAAARYFKFYDLPTAPVVGTTVPAWTLLLPAGSTVNVGFANGLRLNAGFSFAITTGVADTDATATAANDVHGVINYQ